MSWAPPRSTIYAREGAALRHETGAVIAFPKRGPRTEMSDDELSALIRSQRPQPGPATACGGFGT